MPGVVAANSGDFGRSKPHSKLNRCIQPERACVRYDTRQRGRAGLVVAGSRSDISGIGRRVQAVTRSDSPNFRRTRLWTERSVSTAS